MAGRRHPGLKKSNQVENYTREQIIEIQRCMSDPIYFITTYVKIKHPKRGKISFQLYDYQRELVRMYQENRFNIILSARQTGKTETSCAYLLWYVMFQSDKTVLIASNKSSNAMELIAKIQFAYEELPNFLKPGIDDVNWNKHTCSFDNKSRIVSTTTSKDSGRGLAISLIYCDELAFVKPHIQEEFWDSITPTISTGGSMIITSTPNGDSNLFARLWFTAVADTGEKGSGNGFKHLHVKWHQPPGRGEEFRQDMIGKLGERKWRQEFECEFLSSDHTLFDSYMITQAETKSKRIRENYLISGNVFWKKLESNKSYIVAVDPATGSGLDYSVIEVMEFPTMIQVMEFRSNTMSSAVLYTQLKNILTFLEKFSKDIYFSIENNGVGNGLIALYEADEQPPTYAHMVSENGSKKYGFTTTLPSKIKSALKFKELFERNLMTLHSEYLFHEMKNYVRKGTEGYAANPGATDDCIAAFLIIFRILEQMSTYDEHAYTKLYTVGAEIEMEGKWDYREEDSKSLRYSEDEDEDYLPIIIS